MSGGNRRGRAAATTITFVFRRRDRTTIRVVHGPDGTRYAVNRRRVRPEGLTPGERNAIARIVATLSREAV